MLLRQPAAAALPPPPPPSPIPPLPTPLPQPQPAVVTNYHTAATIVTVAINYYHHQHDRSATPYGHESGVTDAALSRLSCKTGATLEYAEYRKPLRASPQPLTGMSERMYARRAAPLGSPSSPAISIAIAINRNDTSDALGDSRWRHVFRLPTERTPLSAAVVPPLSFLEIDKLWCLLRYGRYGPSGLDQGHGSTTRRAGSVARARAGAYRLAFSFCLFYSEIRLTSLSRERARTHTRTFSTRRFEVRGGEVAGQLRAKLNVYRAKWWYFLLPVLRVFGPAGSLGTHTRLPPPFPFSCPTVLKRIAKVPHHLPCRAPPYFLAGRDPVLLAGRYALLYPSLVSLAIAAGAEFSFLPIVHLTLKPKYSCRTDDVE